MLKGVNCYAECQKLYAEGVTSHAEWQKLHAEGVLF
jgi:hypothetical protein